MPAVNPAGWAISTISSHKLQDPHGSTLVLSKAVGLPREENRIDSVSRLRTHVESFINGSPQNQPGPQHGKTPEQIQVGDATWPGDHKNRPTNSAG